ncbi:hypothetical protein [Kitasatospora sp. KL5]|uniref:hypothetical protein n=1 Tax=Kitasatospora sp. KL5 TaxID=3425125 RepID=UPI003D6E1330
MTDTGHPLGAAERGLLLPPPPQAPATVERSKPAAALYTVAGVITALWLMNVSRGVPDLEDADTAYIMGYLLGPLILIVPLALAGLIVQLATKRRRVQVAEDGARAWHAIWERCHRIWQAAWLCRRCRVTFLPKGALGPHFPATPAIAIAQFPKWVTTTAADRTFDVPEPTGPR